MDALFLLLVGAELPSTPATPHIFERGTLRRKLFLKVVSLKTFGRKSCPPLYLSAGRRGKKLIPYFLAPKPERFSGGADGSRTRDSALRTLRNPTLLQPHFTESPVPEIYFVNFIPRSAVAERGARYKRGVLPTELLGCMTL